MKRWLFSSFNLWMIVSILGCFSIIAIQPGLTDEKGSNLPTSNVNTRYISLPTLAQSPATQTPSVLPNQGGKGGVVTITGVQVNPTDKGVEVILQTTQGKVLQPVTLALGKTYIANIPNAVLTFQGKEFRQDNPASGISRVAVTQATANSIRVIVTGETALPQVELYDAPNEGLIFSFTPGASTAQTPPAQLPEDETQPEKPTAEDEPIEILVTGEQDEGYDVPDTSVGTRTDTPLRDIPQSIQIVQEVLRDQNVTNFNDALRNVPGVAPALTSRSIDNTEFVIRGFNSTSQSNSYILRNGLREGRVEQEVLPNIERIEVLRGPASVLYGAGNPGGTINIVTEQPLRDPFYEVEASVGTFDYYRGAIDLSGPLNDSRTLLYRLNVGYLNSGSFVDFFETESLALAPVIRWDIGERTRITLEGEYTDRSQVADNDLPPEGTVLPNPNGEIPRNRFIGHPDSDRSITQYRLGYRLEHEFSDNWSIQQAFEWRNETNDTNDRLFRAAFLAEDQRTIEGFFPLTSYYRAHLTSSALSD